MTRGTFAEVLDAVIGEKNLTIRSFAKQLSAHDDKLMETHRREISRYLQADDPPSPEEETIAFYAKVLGVSRDRFPPAEPRARDRTRVRLAEVEALVGTQQDTLLGLSTQLAELRARVASLEGRDGASSTGGVQP